MAPQTQFAVDPADVRDIVVTLGERVYRGLSWSAESVRSCLASVAEAQAANSPARISRWLDYQLSAEHPGHVAGCLDATLEHLRADASDPGLLADVRSFAVDYFAERTRRAAVSDVLDPHVRGAADACLHMVRSWEPETAEHMEASGALAERLALAMGLDPFEVATAALGARLHDVGKIAISRSIVLKPLALSHDEWADVRLVPLHGASILAGIDALAFLGKFVRAHHERIDGSGYPDQLRGDEIPLQSRIAAVVDAFHAMTVPRPWSRTRAPHEAFRELFAGAGTQFDAEIVREFGGMAGYTERADPAIDLTGFRAG